MLNRRSASRTADIACAARAHGALQTDPRLKNPDSLAGRLAGMPFRLLLYPILRRRFILEFERRVPGIYFHHQARTRLIDALVTAELAAGTEQLVLFGAGFDTRAYRQVQGDGRVRVFEIDHPLTSAEKRRRIARLLGRLPAHVTYLPLDFERDALAEALPKAGYLASRRTIFLWEGVTPYLDAPAVEATLALVGKAAPGSVIAFDYVYASAYQSGADDVRMQLESARKMGEPYRFGVNREDVEALVGRHGMEVIDDADAATAVARYLVGSDGKVWGRPPTWMGTAVARVKAPVA